MTTHRCPRCDLDLPAPDAPCPRCRSIRATNRMILIAIAAVTVLALAGVIASFFIGRDVTGA